MPSSLTSTSVAPLVSMSARKAEILAQSEKFATERPAWRERAAFFHREDEAYLRFLIPKNARVLEIGCGIGDTLKALEPSFGVGVDFSPALIDIARRRHPSLTFHVGDVEDLRRLRRLASRLIIFWCSIRSDRWTTAKNSSRSFSRFAPAKRASSSGISHIFGNPFLNSRSGSARECLCLNKMR